MGMALLLGLIGLVSLLAGLSLLRRAGRQLRSEQTVERLADGQAETERKKLGRLERAFLRAGIRWPRQNLVVWLCAWLSGGLLGLLFGGWFGLLLLLLGPLLTLRLIVAFQYRRRLQRMIEQLPQFLDHVIRSLKSGRALGEGLLLAMQSVPDPLHDALGRSQRNVQRGMPVGEALEDFAELYEREEFRILALGVQVNQRYGGNASELLGNLIMLIREREQGGRRLRAMTGETRISALVLGGLPMALALYIFATNPQFLLGMWAESSGRILLLVAFVLQVLGSFTLWRMLRSI